MKIHRLFGILSILLTRKSITARELADTFEVSVRTIYRDMESIEAAGIPLTTAPGNSGGISIMPDFSLDKTALSEEELEYLKAGIAGIQTVTDDSKLKILLSKLSSGNYVTGGPDILIDFTSWNPETTKEIRRVIAVIRMAVADCTWLEIEYYSAGGAGKRRIAPYKLLFKDKAWYIYGFCNTKQECRFFKLSRIISLESTGEHFQPESYQIPEVWSEDFQETGGSGAVLSFDPSLEYRVLDIFGKASYTNEDGRLIVRFPCNNQDWLIHFVMGFGNRAQIIEPTAAITELKKQLTLMADQYQ